MGSLEDNILFGGAETKAQDTLQSKTNHSAEELRAMLQEMLAQEKDREAKERAAREEQSRAAEEANKKKQVEQKQQEALKRYLDQPRDIRDKLMQYSDSLNLARENVMSFADDLAQKTGKDLNAVAQFLVDNKSNSDYDVKIGNYDEIVNRFASGLQQYNPAQQQNNFFREREEPRYNQPLPTAQEDVLTGVMQYGQQLRNQPKDKRLPPMAIAEREIERVEESIRMQEVQMQKQAAMQRARAEEKRLKQELQYYQDRIGSGKI